MEGNNIATYHTNTSWFDFHRIPVGGSDYADNILYVSVIYLSLHENHIWHFVLPKVFQFDLLRVKENAIYFVF